MRGGRREEEGREVAAGMEPTLSRFTFGALGDFERGVGSLDAQPPSRGDMTDA